MEGVRVIKVDEHKTGISGSAKLLLSPADSSRLSAYVPGSAKLLLSSADSSHLSAYVLVLRPLCNLENICDKLCGSCMFLVHPAPTCADGCWCLAPLTFSNLNWWCFSLQPLAQILHLRSCNLHCVVVVVWWCLYVVVVCDGGVW